MGATTLNSHQADSVKVIHRQRDWGTSILMFMAFFLLASAVFIFVYPWETLTYQLGKAAEPSSPIYERPLAAKSITEWCVDFSPYGDERNLSAPMSDNGTGPDIVAGDGVYSLSAAFSNQGLNYWRVVACAYPNIAYPEAPAWLLVGEANQELALTFDTSRDDSETVGFFPGSFVVNASETLPPLFVYGSLNDWQIDDEQTRLKEFDGDQYRLVYRIPNPGQHWAATTFELDGNLYGYMADGRSDSWNMLQFETQSKNETVVFELDARTGRSAILAGVPSPLAWLAYDKGVDVLLPILAGAFFLIVILAIKRYEIIRRPNLLAKMGCPQCQSIELVRMPRSAAMRLLRFTGLDTGYYVCRQCTWKGIRLVGGSTVEVLGSRRPGPNWAQLVAMLLILVFSITLAIQLSSSSNGTPIRLAIIDSAYQKVSQLAEEFSPYFVTPERGESGQEDAIQNTEENIGSAGSQDDSQGLIAIKDWIAVTFNSWIREVPPNAQDTRNDNPEIPVEEPTEIEKSEARSQFSPVQYEYND